MIDSIWAESLLKSYARLNIYIEVINKRVNLLALTMPSIQYGTTTEVIADKIFKLIDKKQLIFKTQILVDDILSNINKKYAYVLKMKFIQGKTNQEIAEYFKVSERSIRRYLLEALNYFKNYLKKKYEPYNILISYYKNETWMANIFYNCIKKMLWKKNKTLYKKFVKDCDFLEMHNYESLYTYKI